MAKKTENLAKAENSQNSQETENKNAIEFVESDKNSNTDNEADDEMPLQAPKLTKKVREKKPQTEAQKAATAKMRAKLQEKWEKTRAEKEAYEQDRKKVMEEKVLKKAISIKKKQIKQENALDVISDDDTPMEEIIPLIKRKAAPVPASAYARVPTAASSVKPVVPAKPRIIFI